MKAGISSSRFIETFLTIPLAAILLLSEVAFANEINCELSTTSNWGSGSQFSFKITNTTDTPLDSWSLAIEFPEGMEVFNSWKINQEGTNPVTFSSLEGNVLSSGPYDGYWFGFQVNHNGNPFTVPEITRCGTTDLSPVPDELILGINSNRTYGTSQTTFEFSPRIIESAFFDAGTSYLWELSDGRVYSTESVDVIFDEPGPQNVELTVTNSQGQARTASVSIFVYDQDGLIPELELPEQIGDVNQDGLVNLVDVHLLSKFVNRLQNLPATQKRAGDMNFDSGLTTEDVDLLSEAVLDDQSLPDKLLTKSGFPGTLVTLVSPNLLDPTDYIEIEVGNSVKQDVSRPYLGYVTFAIPFTLDLSDTPKSVPVKLYSDGNLVETYDFSLLEPEPLPADPVAEVETYLGELRTLISVSQTLVWETISGQGLTSEDAEILEALTTGGISNAEAAINEMESLLAGPSGEVLAQKFLQGLNANGFSEYRQELQAFITEQRPSSQFAVRAFSASGNPDKICDELIPALCALKTAADLLDVSGKIVSSSCDLLLAAGLGLAIFPGDGPAGEAAALLAWASACSTLELSIDVLNVFKDFVSSIDGDLKLNVENDTPTSTDPAILTPKLEIFGVDEICTLGGKSGTDILVKKLSERAVNRLIMRKFAIRKMKDIFEVLGGEGLQKFLKLLESSAGKAIKVLELDKAITNFANPYCDALGGADAIINAARVLQGPEPDEGTLNFLPDGRAEYYCAEDSSTSTSALINFTATKEICEKTSSVSKSVKCKTKDVTITMGDNGTLNDDIFEVVVNGKTVLTSSSPVRSTSTTITLPIGPHSVQMFGRAAPDGVGTYFVRFTGDVTVSGDALGGNDLTPGTVKNFTLTVVE